MFSIVRWGLLGKLLSSLTLLLKCNPYPHSKPSRPVLTQSLVNREEGLANSSGGGGWGTFVLLHFSAPLLVCFYAAVAFLLVFFPS